AGGCGDCSSGSGPNPGGPMLEGNGMPVLHVSDPYLNVWVEDTPLAYEPAYGPAASLHLAYHNRNYVSDISGLYWHGADLGTSNPLLGVWACSWLSFAELASGDATVDLMLPAGGWATFTFPAGSTKSSINYQHNTWLEQFGPSGGVTNLVLHF